LWLDLEQDPALGIRRSLPAAQLSRGARAVLMPPVRVTWFFEVANEIPADDNGEREARH